MLASIILAGLTLFVGLTQTGFGDSTRVVGRVFGGSHPAANVVVMAISDSDVRVTRTDGHGRYAFLTLFPGVYQLTAVTPDFAARYDAVVKPHCADDSESEVELSAGVEYLANLQLATSCR